MRPYGCLQGKKESKRQRGRSRQDPEEAATKELLQQAEARAALDEGIPHREASKQVPKQTGRKAQGTRRNSAIGPFGTSGARICHAGGLWIGRRGRWEGGEEEEGEGEEGRRKRTWKSRT